jgi:hypothetical protein
VANEVLGVHSSELAGKRWAERFGTHLDKLKMVFS